MGPTVVPGVGEFGDELSSVKPGLGGGEQGLGLVGPGQGHAHTVIGSDEFHGGTVYGNYRRSSWGAKGNSVGLAFASESRGTLGGGGGWGDSGQECPGYGLRWGLQRGRNTPSTIRCVLLWHFRV